MTKIKATLEIEGETFVRESDSFIFASKNLDSGSVASGLAGVMTEGDQAALVAGLVDSLARQSDDYMQGLAIALGGIMAAANKQVDRSTDPAEVARIAALISSVSVSILKAAVKGESDKRTESQGDIQ